MAISDSGNNNPANGNDIYKWDIQQRPSSGGSGGILPGHSNILGDGSILSNKSEPLLVGTNTTGNLTLDLNQSSTNSQPLVVGSNTRIKITVIGGSNSSSSGREPVIVGTNNTVIGAENIPTNGIAPLLVATNSTVEFVLGDDISSSGSTPLVLGTNKTIGSEERPIDSNAPFNNADYQWNLTGSAGVDSAIVDDDPLTAGGSKGFLTAGSNADFFRNLFGAGQASNPDYTYDFGSSNSSGNFTPGGVDFSQFTNGLGLSSGGDLFGADYSFGGGITNSNNNGVALPIVGTNNTILGL